MENCSIETLNGVINNSKMVTVTQLPIEIYGRSSTTDKNSMIRIVHRFDAGEKTVSDGGAIATTYAGLETDPQTSLYMGLFYVKNADFIVKVDDKYMIQKIIMADGTGTAPLSKINLAELTYMLQLIELTARYGAAYGNINSLPPTITKVYLNNNPDVYGSVENFCETQLKTRTSGSLDAVFAYTRVTLHENLINVPILITFGSNSCTITYGGSTIASYDGTTWTYNS